MVPQNEAIVLFNGRSYVYELFQIIFGTDPDEEWLEVVTDKATSEALDLFVNEDIPGYSGALKTFLAAVKNLTGRENTLETLKRDYMNLIVGPGKLPAPPYESVHLTDEKLLFQKSTLDVRNTYIAFGILPAEYPHVPDDHISYELAFMARVNKIALNAYVEGEPGKVKHALDASASFLEKHLLMWIPKYARLMGRAKDTVFYPAAAELLHHFLLADRVALTELSEIECF